jgi:hypothetical protein
VSGKNDGDLAELISLSCLEARVTVSEAPNTKCPTLQIEGRKVSLVGSRGGEDAR